MPKRPLRLCEQPGCGRTQPARYCTTHKRANVNVSSHRDFGSRRGSACKRGYGRRWEKVRKRILARDPLCCVRANMLEIIGINRGLARDNDERDALSFLEAHVNRFCDGTRPSTDVDHILPKPAGDDNDGNLQGACHECHSYKTAIFDSRFSIGGRGINISMILARADRRRTARHTPAK